MVAVDGLAWPSLGWETHVWHPDPNSRGPIDDRMLGEYRSAVAPAIAYATPNLSAGTLATCAAASAAVTDLQQARSLPAALTGALLRSESVASSKIERLDAPQRDVALAAFGSAGVPGGRARAVARAVAANITAMQQAVETVIEGELVLADILRVHELLMADDPVTGSEAGRIRTVQNWIAGSDYSPRNAIFVPPHPQALQTGLTDLLAFCNRVDLHPLAQAAIAHAQFETLHPFSDGNGRTGRALVHVLWRKRALTPTVPVPVSTVLLADVDAYFAGLAAYRAGDVEGWIAQFAAAATQGATAGLSLAQQVEQLHARWLATAGARAGSLRRELVDFALRNPVLDSAMLERHAAVRNKSTVYRALDRLVDDGILVEVTGQGRHRVWVAPAVFELLEGFERQIGRRQRPLV